LKHKERQNSSTSKFLSNFSQWKAKYIFWKSSVGLHHKDVISQWESQNHSYEAGWEWESLYHIVTGENWVSHGNTWPPNKVNHSSCRVLASFPSCDKTP
jgi:hypothetical protein